MPSYRPGFSAERTSGLTRAPTGIATLPVANNARTSGIGRFNSNQNAAMPVFSNNGGLYMNIFQNLLNFIRGNRGQPAQTGGITNVASPTMTSAYNSYQGLPVNSYTPPPTTVRPVGMPTTTPISSASPTQSWQMREADPRFWTNNPNVLQQKDQAASIAAMNMFGQNETPERIAAAQDLVGGTGMDKGAAYARAIDQQTQNKWYWDNIRQRLEDPNSGYAKSFTSQQNNPGAYTKDEFADMLYRTTIADYQKQQNQTGKKPAPPKPGEEGYDPFDYHG